MIFDLVRRKKDNRTMIVVEVGYDENIGAITTEDRFYGDFEDYHETQVEPIPLTSEILEKNGFEEFDGWRILDMDDVEIRWIGTILEISGSHGNMELPNVQCVHELQNALRLCGIDKTIVL